MCEASPKIIGREDYKGERTRKANQARVIEEKFRQDLQDKNIKAARFVFFPSSKSCLFWFVGRRIR